MAEIGHTIPGNECSEPPKKDEEGLRLPEQEGLPQSPYPHVARKVKKRQKWPKNVQKEAPENGVLGVFKVP
jgi:hypothetical protein